MRLNKLLERESRFVKIDYANKLYIQKFCLYVSTWKMISFQFSDEWCFRYNWHELRLWEDYEEYE